MKANKTPVEVRWIHIRKYIYLALAAIIICSVMIGFNQTKLQQNETAAISNAEHQANITTNSDICRSFPKEPLCVLAKEISADPTKTIAGPVGPQGLTGPKGSTGDTGLGVQEFITNNEGRLIVTFTNGNTKDLGEVTGAPGAKGDTGAVGPQGLSGRGITQTAVQDGQLVVTYSDGKAETIGNIVGPAGAQGPIGATGVKGATGDIGAVGPAGQDGATGQAGKDGRDGLTVTKISNNLAGDVTVTYSDGTSAVVGTITDTTTITKFECIDNTLYIQLSSEQEAHSTEVQCVAGPLTPVVPVTPTP